MSGNPTTTPSNVVPMPTNWPGPMFTPKTWPPGGPSCFSELAALNACYDSVQMMEQILAKVVTDLATNNVAFQQALVEAIAKSGSNVPLIGVTNGADAQPGQVGEFVAMTQVVSYPAATSSTQVVSMGTLQPGDWDVQAYFILSAYTSGIVFEARPVPPGFTSGMLGTMVGIGAASDPNAFGGTVFGEPTRALISVPTLIALTLTSNVMSDASATSTGGYLSVYCRRRR